MRPEIRAIKTLAKRLRHFRLLKNISQDRLAEMVDGDRTYISDIERQLRNPTLKTLARLADALDVKIGDLCDP